MRIGLIVKKILPSFAYKQILKLYRAMSRVLDMQISNYAIRKVEFTVSKLQSDKSPIRFGFYVVHSSTFQMRGVFELMAKDDSFAPYIVVVLEERGCRCEAIQTMHKEYMILRNQYGDCVHLGFSNGVYQNFIDRCDACSVMNPYKGMTHFDFTIEHFARHGIPVFFASYFYYCDGPWMQEAYSLSSCKYIYRYFCANTAEQQAIMQQQGDAYATKRTVVTGNPKTDGIYNSQKINKRKVILIAPHHSIVPDDFVGFHIGNFLKYYKFFLSLPLRYPQIDWVLRPHPVLRLRLIQDAGWTSGQWESYVRAFDANANARFEDGGFYYDCFAKSDALIQDCGSFLSEYFLTGKPQCFLLDSPTSMRKQFGEFGRQLLDHTYKAFNQEQILDFIDDVVVREHDFMKQRRDDFTKNQIQINHPHVSEAVLDEIKKILNRK